ncbi:MAG: hypothetical protein O2798_09675 [Chloroflexi bacterium]|nr:hypothetical protein [Chloroflexota bacterium]MDA1241097.1 hypothetical protein [Chloroflexota bacterium]
MPEIRVGPGLPVGSADGVAPASGEQRHQREQRERQDDPPPRGAEELALALDEGRRAHLVAHFEQDADGAPLVRIVDRDRGETVAVMTPEELRAVAEQTGLPTGLLLQVRT